MSTAACRSRSLRMRLLSDQHAACSAQAESCSTPHRYDPANALQLVCYCRGSCRRHWLTFPHCCTLVTRYLSEPVSSFQTLVLCAPPMSALLLYSHCHGSYTEP